MKGYGDLVAWGVVLACIISPLGLAFADVELTYARFGIGFSWLLLFAVGFFLVVRRHSADGPLKSAGDYLRQLARAPYLIFVAGLVGGFFFLAVLLSATMAIPAGYEDIIERAESKLERPSQHRSQRVLAEQGATAEATDLPYRSLSSAPQTAAQATNVVSSASVGENPAAEDVSSTRQQRAQARASRAENKWQEQFPTAVAAFWAGFATILAVGIFYRKIAPYTDLWELVEEMSNDIETLSKSRTKVKQIWWCYAGFALGRFRTLEEDGAENFGSRLFKNFKTTLAVAFASDDVQVNAIVFDEKCLDAFYAAYNFQAKAHESDQIALTDRNDLLATANEICAEPNSPRITKCVETEKEIINFGRATEGSSTNVYKASRPDCMPAFVFVIGDVVYQIASYGSPIFIPHSGQGLCGPFAQIGGVFLPYDGKGDAHLVQLVAYRRDDPAYAKSVIRHLKEHVEAAKNAGVISL